MLHKANCKNTIKRRAPAKADPIIGLIERADAALSRYITASNKFLDAKERLPEKDRGFPTVYPPDFGLRGYWGHGYSFSSVDHIKKEVRNVGRLLKSTSKPKSGPPPSAADMLLKKSISKALPVLGRALVKQFEAEEVRLFRAKRKVGLPGIIAERNKARADLTQVTEQIVKTKPRTAAGAFAAIDYVQHRLGRDDLGSLFADHDLNPRFDFVLRKARNVLRRPAVAQK